MKRIEIRVNPFGELGECTLCGSASSDPDGGASSRPYRPELFLIAEDGSPQWICIFCTRNDAPTLANLIALARVAERYARFICGEKDPDSSAEEDQLSYQLAIRMDTIAMDRPCGLCGHDSVSSSYPSYKIGFPEMFINEAIVCGDCGNRYGPTLDALRDLANEAEHYAQHVPTPKELPYNSNPVMAAVIDSLSWATCPNCNRRFSTKDKDRWCEGIHLTCKQRLRLKERAGTDT